MDLVLTAHYLGALINVAFGAAALGFPGRVADRLGLQPEGALGRSEIRATFGGLFLGLGGFSLWMGDPLLFRMLGFGWLSIGLGRLVSMLREGAMSRDNVIAFTVEMLVAWLLLLEGGG